LPASSDKLPGLRHLFPAVPVTVVAVALSMASASPRPSPSASADPAFAPVDAILSEALASRAFPGAVIAIGRGNGIVHLRALGRVSWETGSPAVQANTIYDLASVTKLAATTTAALVLFDEGRLDLDAPISKYLSAFAKYGEDKARVRDLLAHSAGLPAWEPLYKEIRGQEAYLARIAQMEPEYEPGTRSLYSDLGMIVLGGVIERVTGEGLDSWTAKHVFGPLRMADTLFRPGRELRARIAPTSECPWRGRVIHGEVRDENAYAMGGVAGHAGLFSTAPDLARLAEMLLGGGVRSGRRLVRAETVARFTRASDVPGSMRTLGAEIARGDPWAGTLWSARAYGHTGLTGTALWVDPVNDVFLVLLSNSGTGPEDAPAFREVRRRVSDQALAILRARPSAP
jgi:CubicO group peptidase (beta-lactamase class C family)